MAQASVIDVVRGDITQQDVDAIVNAANSSLMGGGGVDGAIHAAAGPALLQACKDVRRRLYPDGLPTGAAIATTGGDLPARFVIHTVGPKYWEYADGGRELLAAAHRNSLAETQRVGASSVAFPAISCGVYGWNPREAAPIAIEAVRTALADFPDVQRVSFVLINDDAFDAFTRAIESAD